MRVPGTGCAATDDTPARDMAGLVDRCLALLAENTRLHDELAARQNARIAELTAENTRLRAALDRALASERQA